MVVILLYPLPVYNLRFQEISRWKIQIIKYFSFRYKNRQKMSKAKTAAKAALKGKNNLRKKKMRTSVHFKRPKTLRLAR